MTVRELLKKLEWTNPDFRIVIVDKGWDDHEFEILGIVEIEPLQSVFIEIKDE